MASLLDSTRKTMSQANEKHNQFIGFLSQRVTDISQIDQTTAVTQMLSDQTALQASYQSLAQTRSLSLLTYLK